MLKPFAQAGSSPRMRGTLGVSVRRNVGHGIIPAYAGNTEAGSSFLITPRDHPRVCGEHVFQVISSVRMVGSSPRMRGTLEIVVVRGDQVGIIPAYAGNTKNSGGAMGVHRDHPRVCGEHTQVERAREVLTGSSPRMRGTRSCWCLDCAACGIIPAYAGNTHRRRSRRR